MSEIARRWQQVRTVVARAAERSGRDPQAVRIIAASKKQPLAVITEAVAAGISDFGENYVQEAAAKIDQVGAPVRWHLIGHLQRNKARRAVDLFDVVHSVDGTELGAALDRHAGLANRVLPVLLEINMAGEPTKSGIPASAAADLLRGLGGCAHLSIAGLMAMPPPGPSPEAARPYFRRLRELRDELRARAPGNAPLAELSMGMSEDFEVAVEEGATMVRIGRALLGERP